MSWMLQENAYSSKRNLDMGVCKYSKDDNCYSNVRAIIARVGMGSLVIPQCHYKAEDIRVDSNGYYITNDEGTCSTFKIADGLEHLLDDLKVECRCCSSSLDKDWNGFWKEKLFRVVK